MKYLNANTIKLKSLKTHNFMGIEGELFIDFEETNEIVGDNGSGKSTILNAIAFVFCYTDAFGNSNSKVNFSYAGELNTDTFVEIVAEIDEEEVVAKRIFKVSKTGSNKSIFYLNHEEIKAKKLKELIDKDVFLSLINPKYISSLSTEEMKSLLVKFSKLNKTESSYILEELSDEALEFMSYELEEQEDAAIVIQEYHEERLKELKLKLKTLKDDIKFLANTEHVPFPDVEYTIGSETYTSDSDALNEILSILEKDFSKTNQDYLKQFIALKSSNEILRNKHLEYETSLMEINNKKAEIEKIEKKIKEKEKELSYIEEYFEELLNYLEINDIFDDIEISFKNNVGKKEFQILYNGVPLSECSFAEQVKNGMRICDWIMEKLDLNYPIFIDNAECLTSLPFLFGRNRRQLISLTVKKGLNISRYIEDNVEDLETLETLPRESEEDSVSFRLLNTEL